MNEYANVISSAAKTTKRACKREVKQNNTDENRNSYNQAEGKRLGKRNKTNFEKNNKPSTDWDAKKVNTREQQTGIIKIEYFSRTV